MAPSASRPWETPTQSSRERPSCPCVCAHGASRPTGPRSLTEATRSNSPSGTSKPPLRQNSNHHHHHPRNRNPKALRNENAEPSRSFPESYGEQKMYVGWHTDNDTSYLDCQSSRAHMAFPEHL